MGATKKTKKTILQAKMQIISLYIDLIDSNVISSVRVKLIYRV